MTKKKRQSPALKREKIISEVDRVYRRQLLTEETLSIIRRAWVGSIISVGWAHPKLEKLQHVIVVVLKKNKTKPSHKLQSNAGHCKLLLQFLNATVQPAKYRL